MKTLVFDIEADGFNPTLIYVLSVWDGKKLSSYTNYQEMKFVLLAADNLVGHNIQRFDIPVIERILGIKIEARLIDTLALSWYLYPKKRRHGLADWGEFFGVPKPKIDDWFNLPLKEYIHRCEEDVKINKRLWNKIKRYLENLYEGDMKNIWRFLKYIENKMDCAKEAEKSRWLIDKAKAVKHLAELEAIRDEKLPQLIEAMPEIPDYQDHNFPAKPYKKDGTLSVTGVKWFSLLRKQGLPKDHKDVVRTVRGYKVPNPKSYVQLKSWLFELGWEPEHFKYDRNKETQEVKKIPQLKDESDDSQLCPSILRLAEKEPAIEMLNGLSVVNHRISFFEGYLKAEENSWVKAEIAGLTNTLRFKHKAPLANIPGVGKPWGKQIRGCLIAPKGYELCGSDQSSLEDRTKLHYMFDYDPDYVKEMSVAGFDPHLDLAYQAGVLTKEQVQAYKDGDRTNKKVRDDFKAGNYACIYGVQAATLSRQLKCSLEKAQSIIDVYWKRNWSVKKLAEDQTVKTVNGQKWLLNPVSGFWYSLRYEKDRFSTLNQGTGVYAFDTWIEFIRSKRPQLTGQFHDEIILTVKVGFREKCHNLLKWAVKQTNEKLKLNRDLDVDIQFGDDYAQIH